MSVFVGLINYFWRRAKESESIKTLEVRYRPKRSPLLVVVINVSLKGHFRVALNLITKVRQSTKLFM